MTLKEFAEANVAPEPFNSSRWHRFPPGGYLFWREPDRECEEYFWYCGKVDGDDGIGINSQCFRFWEADFIVINRIIAGIDDRFRMHLLIELAVAGLLVDDQENTFTDDL